MLFLLLLVLDILIFILFFYRFKTIITSSKMLLYFHSYLVSGYILLVVEWYFQNLESYSRRLHEKIDENSEIYEN